ncbi:MAG: phosphoenolpyruvate--protein phosphotransferase [Verrucomicrobiota bacterium]
MSQPEDAQEKRYKGIAVVPGVTHGKLVVIDREELHVPPHEIQESDIPNEISRLESALIKTREQIQEIKDHLSQSLGEKDASIFDAHLLVVEDSSITEAVKKQLQLRKLCVEYIYHHLTQSFAQSMREVDDPYLKERSSDILDVGRRVLNNLMGNAFVRKIELSEPCIVVAHDLTPSDTAVLNRELVLGFATDLGNKTSHTAIMARSMNIPAIVGLKDISQKAISGQSAILDGYEGYLITDATDDTNFAYGRIEKRRHEVEESLASLREVSAETKDGRRIIVSANVELPADLEMLPKSGAEGIGLYRSEFLFLNRMELPDEQEQLETYRKVVQASKPYPAIIRTLDIGGDKLLEESFVHDDLNPFLGWRAIRYLLERTDVFKTQLRAILRAGAGTSVRIMFPMIATYEELMRSKEILEECMHELDKEGIAQAKEIELGAMVEVPSFALTVEKAIEEVDFLSIGTNDLVQYTLAVDRTNEKVAYLYQPCHPAIIHLIKHVVDVAHAHSKWVGVCGEMAGEITLTPMLLGLGIDELSMGSIFISRVKRAIQTLTYRDMQAMVEEVQKFNTSEQIQKHLDQIALAHYPELLE